MNINNQRFLVTSSEITAQFSVAKSWSNRTDSINKDKLESTAVRIGKEIAVDLCAASFAFLLLAVLMLLMLLGPDAFFHLLGYVNFSLAEWFRNL